MNSAERRLEGKVALIVGAGQTPGPKMGNGRATALLFAREGAQVLAASDPKLRSRTTRIGMYRLP